MKKLISIILTAILAAALNGYNGTASSETAGPEESSAQTTENAASSSIFGVK